MRSISLAAVLAAALVSAAGAQNVVGRNEDVWTWSERVSRGDWFRVHAHTGTITVTESSGDRVEVRAEKRVRRGRISDIGFIVMRNNDGVTICAVFEGDDCDNDGIQSDWRSNSRDRASLDVTVRLPRGIKLLAKSGNGAVSVSGAGDEVIASSGNGEVRVNGAGGRVEASSGNGAVSVDGARGPVGAHSGNGAVSVATSIGPVSANSGNGDIDVVMDALGARQNMEFTTGNGRIRITLPSGFAADIDASTGNGDIVTDFPIELTGRISRSHMRGTIGSGGPRVRLVSGNGAIELRRGR